MPLEAVTATYSTQVERVATETRKRLLRIWDSLAPWTEADIDRFHDIAGPLIRAAAQAGVDLSTVYANATLPETGTPSPLIVEDAAARLYDPADRIGRLINTGSTFEEAVQAARQVVDDLGHDTVYSSARQSYAELAPRNGSYQRRVSGKSCKWCLSLAGAVFPTAAAATFGHAHCDCLAVESAATAGHNQKIIDDAGGDVAVRKYKQAGRLRKSERTARRHQEQARLEQLTETDPARLERLSTREQEWETRAERAAERLQLLTAP